MIDKVKVALAIILFGFGIYGIWKFLDDVADEPIAYSRAWTAFSGSLPMPLEDSAADELRTLIINHCGVVSYQKLSAAAANQSISFAAQLVGGRTLTSAILAEVLTRSAQVEPESSDELKCLVALTLMRTEYPESWKLVNDLAAGVDDLDAIGRKIDEALKLQNDL